MKGRPLYREVPLRPPNDARVFAGVGAYRLGFEARNMARWDGEIPVANRDVL